MGSVANWPNDILVPQIQIQILGSAAFVTDFFWSAVPLIPAINLSPMSLTPLKNDSGDNDTDNKFFDNYPVTTALAINLLPVSMTLVNNDRR
jgi:hypothetical protein